VSRAIAVLVWFAFVPLIRTCLESSPRQSLYKGWIAGTAVYIALLYWIVPTFHAAGQSLWLSIPALVALSIYLGLFWGIWTWGLTTYGSRPTTAGMTNKKNPSSHEEKSSSQKEKSSFHEEKSSSHKEKLSSPAGVGGGSISLCLFGAASWVALEWVRTWFLSGFPWALLADSQVHVLPLIQMSSITGSYGVSFLIILANLAMAFMIDRHWKPLLLSGVLTGSAVIYGMLMLKTPFPQNPETPIRVALLQGNVDQYKKWNDVYVSEIKTTYETLAKRAEEAKAELIVWPETSVPGYLIQDLSLRAWLTKVIWRTDATHIVGSPAAEDDKIFNSAYVIHRTGWITGEYAKKHLVPFGEVIPFQAILGRWIPVLNALGGFTAGRKSPVLTARGIPVGMNICYEAIFPNLVRKSVKTGAQLIVNVTNDGWYMKTAAPYQHLAPNIYRAVENRRWLLRANNTGVSAIIDPYGRLVAQTPIYQTKILTGEVVPVSEQTFYTRFGNVFCWLCVLFCVVIGRRARIRAR